MKYEATNPKYVFSKLDECKFFLGQLTEYRQRIDEGRQQHLPAEFLHYVSAYLSSFRCAAYRLIGVMRHRDILEGRRVKDQLRTYADIAFVRDISDLEMHGDGVVIWPRYKTEVPKNLLPHRWSRDTSGHGNRFDRYNRGIVNTV